MANVTVLAARAQERFPLVQALVVVVLFCYGATTVAGFAGSDSLRAMAVLAALLGLASAGPTLAILLGGLDLAVPAYMAAGATLTPYLYATRHWPIWAVFVVVVGGSMLVGAATGFLSHRFGVPSLVLTLGASAVVTGVVLVTTNGVVTGAPPGWLTTLVSPRSNTFGLAAPPLVLGWAAVAVAMVVFLGRTAPGRRFYAVGDNPIAARYARVNVGRTWVVVFMAGAALSAGSGILLGAFAGGGDLNIGNPYLFEGLAAMVIGGIGFGGRGGYLNTVVGAVLLTVIGTLLVAKSATAADQQILYGVLIAVVVGIRGRGPSVRQRL